MPSAICQSTRRRKASSSIEPFVAKGVTIAVPQPDSESPFFHLRASVMTLALRLDDVLHREYSVPSDEPLRRDDRPFGKDTAIAGDVREAYRLERRIEDHLVGPGNRPRSNTGDRDRLAPGGRGGLFERRGGPRRGVFFRRMVELDHLGVETAGRGQN